MDKRTLLAIVLSIAVYYFYMMWVSSGPQPEVDTGQPEVAETDGAVVEAGTSDAESSAPPPSEEPPAPVVPSVVHPVRSISFAGCDATGNWTTESGSLNTMKLDNYRTPYETQALWSYLLGLVTGGDTTWTPYGETPPNVEVASAQAQILAVGSGGLDTPSPSTEVVSESADSIVLRGVTADGIEVTRKVSLAESEPCVFDVEVTWKNTRSSKFTGPLWLGVHSELPEDSTDFGMGGRPVSIIDGYLETTWDLFELEQPQRHEGGTPSVFGLSDQYFSLVLLTESDAKGTAYHNTRFIGETPIYGVTYAMEDGLDVGASYVERFRMYTGANELEHLWEVSDQLGYLVDFGWLAAIAKPLLWLLRRWHDVVGDWGLSIILLTVTLKAVLFPLTNYSFKSSARMQAVQPELTKIREECKDNQEEMSRRTMALFKENGVNPLGGCLPMVLQMPIWFALYQMLLYSVELYHTKFLFYLDLSSQDPYNILPVLVMVVMVGQMSFTPTGNMDPNQRRLMRLMPLVFGILFFTFPAGLVLYVFVNTSLSVAQQWVIKRGMNAPAGAEAA